MANPRGETVTLWGTVILTLRCQTCCVQRGRGSLLMVSYPGCMLRACSAQSSSLPLLPPDPQTRAFPGSELSWETRSTYTVTANLPTNIADFRGFDSSIILILRGGIPRPIGYLAESFSQAMLVGVMLVGRIGRSWRARSGRVLRQAPGSSYLQESSGQSPY